MTKKDYIAIAKAFALVRKHRSQYQHAADWGHTGGGDVAVIRASDAEDAIASVLAADNPQFDRDRFLAACGR